MDRAARTFGGATHDESNSLEKYHGWESTPKPDLVTRPLKQGTAPLGGPSSSTADGSPAKDWPNGINASPGKGKLHVYRRVALPRT